MKLFSNLPLLPREDSKYYLLPEWTPQSGIMLVWPCAESDWEPWFNEVETTYRHLACEIARREKLLVVCRNLAHLTHVKNQLVQLGLNQASLSLRLAPFNDTWVRDYGPLNCLDWEGRPQLLDFVFNGWGGKYEAMWDNEVTLRLHQQGAFGSAPLERCGLVLEGGSIEVDGAGSLLTTAGCLLSTTRNGNITQEIIEERLKQWFGVTQVLWLHHGRLAGDDTDGHIDTLARFCNPQTICYTACDDPKDEHYPELSTMADELRTLQTATGTPYRLVPLPWPRPQFNTAGQRLPASYANFLILNDALLVPTYRDPADAKALSILQNCFSDRRVVGIDCLPLLQQYGSLHCLTMQLTAGII